MCGGKLIHFRIRFNPLTAMCPRPDGPLLFLGSHGGNSQLLLVPPAACAADAAAAGASLEQPWPVAEPAFIDNTAPVHAVQTVQGADGAHGKGIGGERCVRADCWCRVAYETESA